MITATELQNQIASEQGTENYHFCAGVAITDGVKRMCANVGAFWLIDAISSYQGKVVKAPMTNPNETIAVRNIDFQVWTLKVTDDAKAVLTLTEDSGQPAIITQKIGYTDFPVGTWKVWIEGKVGNPSRPCVILPSEH